MSLIEIAVHWRPDLDRYSYSHRWVQYLESAGVKVRLVDMKSVDVISRVRGCDGVMWHWYHIPDDKQSAPKILDAIETALGIPVFPDYATRWHYDEKVAQYYLFEALDIPRIRTWVFWDYEAAMEFCRSADYPLVFKHSVGAASANVALVGSSAEAMALVKRMFRRVFFPYTMHEFSFRVSLLKPSYYRGLLRRLCNSLAYIVKNEYPPLPVYYLFQKNYVYFQEYCARNPFDIRITVIGNRAFGFTRANREGDFRASGSGAVDYELSKIPLEAVALCFRVSKLIKAQSAAYDVLYDNCGRLVINEITYCFVNTAVYDAPGHWDEGLNWHAGRVHPNDAQAADFIGRITCG